MRSTGRTKHRCSIVYKAVSHRAPRSRISFLKSDRRRRARSLLLGLSAPSASLSEADETRRRREYEMNALRREPVTHTSISQELACEESMRRVRKVSFCRAAQKALLDALIRIFVMHCCAERVWPSIILILI